MPKEIAAKIFQLSANGENITPITKTEVVLGVDNTTPLKNQIETFDTSIEEINNIELEARTDYKGKVYNSMKDRIDAEAREKIDAVIKYSDITFTGQKVRIKNSNNKDVYIDNIEGKTYRNIYYSILPKTQEESTNGSSIIQYDLNTKQFTYNRTQETTGTISCFLPAHKPATVDEPYCIIGDNHASTLIVQVDEIDIDRPVYLKGGTKPGTVGWIREFKTNPLELGINKLLINGFSDMSTELNYLSAESFLLEAVEGKDIDFYGTIKFRISILDGDFMNDEINPDVCGVEFISVIPIEGNNITITATDGVNTNSVHVQLPQPLMCLPNGVKDKLLIRNGLLTIEQNVDKIFLDETLLNTMSDAGGLLYHSHENYIHTSYFYLKSNNTYFVFSDGDRPVPSIAGIISDVIGYTTDDNFNGYRRYDAIGYADINKSSPMVRINIYDKRAASMTEFFKLHPMNIYAQRTTPKYINVADLSEIIVPNLGTDFYITIDNTLAKPSFSATTEFKVVRSLHVAREETKEIENEMNNINKNVNLLQKDLKVASEQMDLDVLERFTQDLDLDFRTSQVEFYSLANRPMTLIALGPQPMVFNSQHSKQYYMLIQAIKEIDTIGVEYINQLIDGYYFMNKLSYHEYQELIEMIGE